MSARSLDVDLAIPAEDYLRMYEGSARDVVAHATNGQTVRFPANILRRFVLHDGVYGRFRIRFDERGKFIAIERLQA